MLMTLLPSSIEGLMGVWEEHLVSLLKDWMIVPSVGVVL